MEKLLKLSSSLGLGHLEIIAEMPQLNLRGFSDDFIQDLKNSLRTSSLEPMIHAPFIDVNLASLNPYIREASVKAVIKSLELAARLGARIVDVHAGTLSRDIPLHYLKEARQACVLSLRELCRQAEDFGILIGVENSSISGDRRIVSRAEEHRSLLKEVDSDVLGATLDFGHANTFGLKAGEYLEAIKSDLIHVHLHDNRKKDEHLSLGKGTLSLEELKPLKNMRIPLTFEVKSIAGLKESIELWLNI
jgi:sugar phosphate isomerase/epimerase